MSNVQRAIIPGFFAGCIFLIFFAGLLTDTSRVLALASGDALAAASVMSASAGAALASEASAAPAEEAAPQPTAEPEPVAMTAGGSCAISTSYPEKIQRWCGQISAAAAAYHLDANLIAAVMLQESAGNPDAYSKSGAVGLMQVMPRDGLAASFMCKNGPCFTNRPSMDELFNPDFNIDYGARMLAGLIERNGSVRDGLRSYGPMDMGYRYADIVLGHYQRYQP